jgi:hypothetical protein
MCWSDHVVEAEPVEISEASVLPVGMHWVRDGWAYVTPHGLLQSRSGDWIVPDRNGCGTVVQDEEFQCAYRPCPKDAASGPERWAEVDAHGRAKVFMAESPARTAPGASADNLHGIRELTATRCTPHRTQKLIGANGRAPP